MTEDKIALRERLEKSFAALLREMVAVPAEQGEDPLPECRHATPFMPTYGHRPVDDSRQDAGVQQGSTQLAFH